ncbi:MAG TPA: lipid-A-disaccharide synthase [Rhodospirillaceae bacterium]|nr:lipid-A-disaccharide synthase [Rhodospirillaceae bacterium]
MPNHDTTQPPLFFLVAGEASGDYLGANLMRALKKKTGGAVRFAGVGGPRMQAEGIDLLFLQSDLAHMGLFELVRHLPLLMRRICQTIDAVAMRRPAALITIDSPDFSFRVAKKLKGLGVPLIHYVAPTVWAWRPKRAKKVAQFLDHLLALLPFEPPYFTREGLPCTFVGHPLVESNAGQGDANRFRAAYHIPLDAMLLSVLPGSRVGEVKRLLPIFRETILRLREAFPKLQVVVPVVESVAPYVQSETDTWPVPVHLTHSDDDKYDAFAASHAALACSGTVSVELALAALPSVIAYKIGKLTGAIYRRLIKTRYASLVNIMQDRMVLPEYIQEDCTPDNLARALTDLLSNDTAHLAMKDDLTSIGAWLGRGQFVPSEKAAETVWHVAFPAGDNT